MGQIYKVSEAEAEIILRGMDDVNVFAEYFYGGTWLFDKNFTERGAWQKALHHAAQKNIVIIGGYGTGKTSGVGMSAFAWAAMTPNFRFLNIAHKAWQASQMFETILTNIQGTPAEKLIAHVTRRPPKINIRYEIGGVVIDSTLEFMSADKDATGILSFEGDWVNIEEAGLFDNLDEIVSNVGSRLRGTVRGRERLGRLSLISNSWDNPYLWYMFDLAKEDPENHLSIVVSTRDNKNISPQQLENIIKRIPPDQREQFLDGTRPEGRGHFFSKQAIYACEEPADLDAHRKAVEDGRPGFILYEYQDCGVAYFAVPPEPGHVYAIFGDPGTGNAPYRNAPVLIAVDYTDFPNKPAAIRGFFWGFGNGQIGPFVSVLKQLINQFHPVFIGVDSTGPQKGLVEMINMTEFGNNEIVPMDFSGSRKPAYLSALRIMIEKGLIRWPKFLRGIRSQLSNYEINDGRLAQDIVAAMGMMAYFLGSMYNVGQPEEETGDVLVLTGDFDTEVRRLANELRLRRSIRARPNERAQTFIPF